MGRRKKKFRYNLVYDPRLHPYEVIELMKNGKSITKVCAEFGITRQTFYNWKDNYPEFKDAVELGVVKSQAWWEDTMQDGAQGKIKYFDSRAASFMMASRFDDYKEQPKNPGVTNNFLINVEGLSDDELNKKIIDMAKRSGVLDMLNQGITIDAEPVAVEYQNATG